MLQDGQLKGAADVLERAFEALESIRSNDNPEAGTWASGAPMLAVQLLKAQLYCGRAVCAARMADKTLSRDMAQKAAELQADALKKAADLEEGKSFGLDAAGPTMTVVSAAAAVRGIKQQLTASLLLSGSIEMALSEYEAAASFYEKVKGEASPFLLRLARML